VFISPILDTSSPPHHSPPLWPLKPPFHHSPLSQDGHSKGKSLVPRQIDPEDLEFAGEYHPRAARTDLVACSAISVWRDQWSPPKSQFRYYDVSNLSVILEFTSSVLTDRVQIYPAAAIRECSMTSGPDRINRSKVSSSQARRATPQGPVHRIDPHAEGEDTTSHVTDQLWETTSFVQSVSSIETVVARLPTPPPAEEPEETSVAYVHFRSVSYCKSRDALARLFGG
jgi:hypothetical protein